MTGPDNISRRTIITPRLLVFSIIKRSTMDPGSFVSEAGRKENRALLKTASGLGHGPDGTKREIKNSLESIKRARLMGGGSVFMLMVKRNMRETMSWVSKAVTGAIMITAVKKT